MPTFYGNSIEIKLMEFCLLEQNNTETKHQIASHRIYPIHINTVNHVHLAVHAVAYQFRAYTHVYRISFCFFFFKKIRPY